MEENNAVSKPGGSKKFLILGLLAGLLLGGGAAAGFFLFVQPQSPPLTGASGDGTEEKRSSRSIFVKLDRLSAPLVAGNTVAGYMLLDLSLEVGLEKDEMTVIKRLPAIRAAFLREVTEAPISKPDQPFLIDYDSLITRLKDAANRELGGAIVFRVLVMQATRL